MNFFIFSTFKQLLIEQGRHDTISEFVFTHLINDGVPFELRPVFKYHVDDLHKFFAGQSRGCGSVEEIHKIIQQKVRSCRKKQRKDRLYRIKKDDPSCTKQPINVKISFFNCYSYPLVITLPPKKTFCVHNYEKYCRFFILLVRLTVVSCFSLFRYKVMRIKVYVDLLLYVITSCFFFEKYCAVSRLQGNLVFEIINMTNLQCFYFFFRLKVKFNEFRSKRAIDLSVQQLTSYPKQYRVPIWIE